MDHESAIARVDQVECTAYLTLYREAAHLGCGFHEIDGVTVVWSAHDEDPGFSCVLNLGDADDPGAMLERLEVAAGARGAGWIGVDTPPSLGGWGTDDEFIRRGYVPDYDEFIVAIDLTRAELSASQRPDLRIERVTTPESLDVFARTLNVGYDVPADHVRGRVFGATIGLLNWYHYLAWIDDQPASASVMFLSDGVADLYVTTTVPELRGRGAQNALIVERMRDAQAAGCDIATSQVIVSNASPRNMARQGFEVLYRRSIWGKRLR